MRSAIPPLLPGLVGAAFHAVIHAGWATDVESIDMAGEGLAYMATAFQPLATDNPFEPPQLWSTEGKNIIEATLEFLTRDDIEEMTRAKNFGGDGVHNAIRSPNVRS